ncbi:DUF4261 domain-containing protein [Limnoglobus roseus]|uniref:DUF4261 domain-containing protein n=1 Tax=Limnoglobus roseus TaxID=2598579 RepID=A0A5C1A9L0_9BACT|nr:DUF4261 domain-containing protein [Limnoglobus roseus]QEL13804.1 hypothetical protein PX52LOC_00662 [Limnoglobus roseus]
MPTKGQITACACVLFERPVVFSQFERALSKDYEIVKSIEQPVTEWMFAGPTLIIPYRPDVGGYAIIDLVDQPWPDAMGDSVKDQMLFAAWGQAQFGPFTQADSLKRATEQAWAWEPGKAAIENHSSFARVRISYSLGGGGDGTPLMPTDYDPTAELQFVTQLAVKLMNLPQTFCYFNPNGEVLRGRAETKDAVKYAAEEELPPVELWANVRLFTLIEGWLMMDTAGHSQFNAPGRPDFPDFEAVFPKGSRDPHEVGEFFRNLSLYLLSNGPDTIKDGDTIDGPGGSWQVLARKGGLMMPPRPTLRMHPVGNEIPEPFGSMGVEV